MSEIVTFSVIAKDLPCLTQSGVAETVAISYSKDGTATPLVRIAVTEK
ncbi:hypothetical protein [Echinicola rosea]|nr:hypothetical protein [Echinicola rosea]